MINNFDNTSNYSAFAGTTQEEFLNLPKIRDLMSQTGLSVTKLAEKMGKDRPSVSKILNGQRKDIALSTTIALAKALDATVDEILL